MYGCGALIFTIFFLKGASFNNMLDALDASYCTFEGGDDLTQDGVSLFSNLLSSRSLNRDILQVSTRTLSLEVSINLSRVE